MDKKYTVFWSEAALDELNNILAYPLDVKERIYLDSFSLTLKMGTPHGGI